MQYQSTNDINCQAVSVDLHGLGWPSHDTEGGRERSLSYSVVPGKGYICVRSQLNTLTAGGKP